MDERYRAELDQIRLTEESKAELARVLARRQEAAPGRTRRPWKRTALVLVAVMGVLALYAGAAVLSSPVLWAYLGGGNGYTQSAVQVSEGITQNGWTVTVTDCVADDYNLWVGLEMTAPEGTRFDPETDYTFLEQNEMWAWDLQTGGIFRQVEDEDPEDNKLHFVARSYLIPDGEPEERELRISLSRLCHRVDQNAEETGLLWAYDCEETWDFTVEVPYPDNAIRLYPNLPVHTLDVDATITEVMVSPLSVYVRIEGDSLKGHHDWVPKNAPDGYYGCVEYQEITLYTTDGSVIPMSDEISGSACSGGEHPETEDGYLRLVRRPEAEIMDVDSLDHLTVCGVEIPLR